MMLPHRSNSFGRLWRLLAALLLLCGGAPLTQAQQDIEIRTTARDDSVHVGEPLALQISVNGSQSPSDPVWPRLDGVDVTPRGGQIRTQSFTSFVNGQRRETRFEGYIFSYTLVFRKTGLQTIPALTVVVDGKEYQSNPITINVRPPQERPEVRLRIAVDNTSPLVGEAIELTATLYLRQTVQEISLQFPSLDRQFELYDAPGVDPNNIRQPAVDFLGSRTPGERGQAMLDGQQYQTFTMRKLLVPLHEGAQKLGPATLSCEIVLRERSFFDEGKVQRAAVPSNEVRLNVNPLPDEGRPAQFTGLIGRYKISAAASASEVNIGDPITLTIRVGSTGAVLREPQLNLEDQPAFKDRFRISESASEPKRQGGEIIYEQIIRPLSDDVKEIPPIELPYFDTQTGRYAVASTNAIPLTVHPTRIVTAGDAQGAAPVGSDVEDASGGIAHNFSAAECLVDQRFNLMLALRNPVWIGAIAGPPVVYFAALLAGLWRRRAQGDQSGKRRRRALATARSALGDSSGGPSPVERVGRAVRQYVADRFDRPVAGLTTADCVELVRAVDPALGPRLHDILDQCDAARYSGTILPQAGDLSQTAEGLLAAIDRATASGEAVRA